MFSTIIAILSIYIFVAIGYFTKMKFKEEISERTLTLISIYSLQPIMVIWGLTLKPIDTDLIYSPFIYMIAIFIVLLLIIFLSKFIFNDRKDKSIFTVTSLIGNTGNLGIPLGIILFGQESIAYTTMINLANVFFVYTFGVYFFSRSNFSIKDSILNILKLPVFWFAILGVLLNLNGVIFSGSIYQILEMGAYATMVIQLMLFGMYLYSTKIKYINYKLLFHIVNIKFIILPIVGMIVLSFFDISTMTKSIIFLELAVPLAVMNVNLASLYNCKTVEVTSLTFITSMIFLGLIFIDILIIKHLL